jgi:hypothetical protein
MRHLHWLEFKLTLFLIRIPANGTTDKTQASCYFSITAVGHGPKPVPSTTQPHNVLPFDLP